MFQRLRQVQGQGQLTRGGQQKIEWVLAQRFHHEGAFHRQFVRRAGEPGLHHVVAVVIRKGGPAGGLRRERKAVAHHALGGVVPRAQTEKMRF